MKLNCQRTPLDTHLAYGSSDLADDGREYISRMGLRSPGERPMTLILPSRD